MCTRSIADLEEAHNPLPVCLSCPRTVPVERLLLRLPVVLLLAYVLSLSAIGRLVPAMACQGSFVRIPLGTPAARRRTEAQAERQRVARAALSVGVLDVRGRRRAKLADGTLAAGRHDVACEAAGACTPAPAGLYFVRFEWPGGSMTRRLTVARTSWQHGDPGGREARALGEPEEVKAGWQPRAVRKGNAALTRTDSEPCHPEPATGEIVELQRRR